MLTPSSYHSPIIPKPDQPCLCGKSKNFGRCCGSTKTHRPPPHGVLIKRALIKPAHCDALVNYAEVQEAEKLMITHGSEKDNALVHSLERTSKKVRLGSKRDTVVRWVDRAFKQIAEPHYSLTIDEYEPPSLMRYESGGYYHAHADSEIYNPSARTWKRAVNRDISLLIYLNDNYQGGGLHFTYFNFSYQPKKGDLVMFPSDHRYMHEAQLVQSGTRYAVVSWASAIGSERV